jgi:hypothetical protein
MEKRDRTMLREAFRGLRDAIRKDNFAKDLPVHHMDSEGWMVMEYPDGRRVRVKNLRKQKAPINNDQGFSI